MTTRRAFVAGAGALAGWGFVHGGRARAGGLPDTLAADLARIELESGGRLGVAVLDTGSGVKIEHHGDERFPMCSTFKLVAAAAVLKRVDQGQERLDRRIAFAAGDIVVNSPVTKARVGGSGMTLAEICEAAMTMSDNTAGNLILAALGGPVGFTAYVRSLGDSVTRLDRIEPELNAALPGDPRDTTTPLAMLGNLQKLVLGDTLSGASKEQLTKWLLGNKTGDTRLRAQLPAGWRTGDKTGAGDRGTNNDVGVLWPPDGEPIVVAAYLTGTTAPVERRNATLAAVGRAVAAGGPKRGALKRDDFSSNRHPALASYLSMILSENRFTLFGIMR
ncbi:MAG: class A beta-lactamase [Xanthobacteraceae bacterium]|nr:class A beta-lactamase [Xanthobacteraceae bacterium]